MWLKALIYGALEQPEKIWIKDGRLSAMLEPCLNRLVFSVKQLGPVSVSIGGIMQKAARNGAAFRLFAVRWS